MITLFFQTVLREIFVFLRISKSLREWLRLPREDVLHAPQHMARLRRNGGFPDDSIEVIDEGVRVSIPVEAFGSASVEDSSVSRVLSESYFLFPRFLYRLRLARVFVSGTEIAILNSADYLLVSLCRGKVPTRLNPVFRRGFFRESRRIDGRTLLLNIPESRVFYHVLFDLAPQIDVVSRSSLSIDAIDHILIPRAMSGWALEILEFAGVELEKVIVAEDSTMYSFEELVIPSLKDNNYVPHPKEIGFLREKIEAMRVVRQRGDGKKFYFCRGDASRRKILNENEVIEALESNGFESLALGNLSLREKVSLLECAECVVGLSGSSFGNLIFLPEGCRVLEIFAPGFVYPTYAILAHYCGLKYDFVEVTGADNREPMDSLNLDPVQVVEWVKRGSLHE